MEDLPVTETVTLDLPEEQKVAPDGTPLVKIREECQRPSGLDPVSPV